MSQNMNYLLLDKYQDLRTDLLNIFDESESDIIESVCYLNEYYKNQMKKHNERELNKLKLEKILIVLKNIYSLI